MNTKGEFVRNEEYINEHRNHAKALRLMNELVDVLSKCQDKTFVDMVRTSVKDGIQRADLQDREHDIVVAYEVAELKSVFGK